MCYNNCSIQIESAVGGSGSLIKTSGRVTKTTDGYRFEYDLDGDCCVLTVGRNETVQERRGGQNIKLIFRKGEKTNCVIGTDGFSGSLPLFTHDIGFKENGGYSLLIVYTLGEDKITLKNIAKNSVKG